MSKRQLRKGESVFECDGCDKMFVTDDFSSLPEDAIIIEIKLTSGAFGTGFACSWYCHGKALRAIWEKQ